MNRGVKLLEHAMKIVEEALEKKPKKIATIDDMLFGLIQVRVQFMWSLF